MYEVDSYRCPALIAAAVLPLSASASTPDSWAQLDSGLKLVSGDTMADAAQKIVKLVA